MRRARAALALALAAAAGGCFRATVRSGEPPGSVPPGYDEKWHHGLVGGLIQLSGPYALDRVCPDGWAEVQAKTDPLDSLLNLVTTTLYSPQAVRVVCAVPRTPNAASAPSSSSYPPPVPTYPPPLPSADPF